MVRVLTVASTRPIRRLFDRLHPDDKSTAMHAQASRSFAIAFIGP